MLKKICLTIFIVCYFCSTCLALDEEFIKTLKQFEYVLESGEIQQLNNLILDEMFKNSFINFLDENEVKNFSFSVRKIEEITSNNYEVHSKVVLEYKKRDGIVNNKVSFMSTFIFERKDSTLHIVKADLFKELESTSKLSDFVLLYAIIASPTIGHIIINKRNKKWIIVILILNLIGVVLYWRNEKKRNPN